MNKRKLWSRILNIVGLAMIVVGAVSVFRAVLMPALVARFSNNMFHDVAVRRFVQSSSVELNTTVTHPAS